MLSELIVVSARSRSSTKGSRIDERETLHQFKLRRLHYHDLSVNSGTLDAGTLLLAGLPDPIHNYDVRISRDDSDLVGHRERSASSREKRGHVMLTDASVADFVKENPQYVAQDNALGYLSDDGGNSYNLCHCTSPLPLHAETAADNDDSLEQFRDR